MSITRKHLENVVDDLNRTLCKRSKNELIVVGAYGGYRVRLTGKRDKRTKNGYRKGSLRSGQTNITYGYQSSAKTIDDLYATVRSGSLKRTLNYWDNCKK